MSKLPVVSAKELLRALEKEGFQVIRQKGSHLPPEPQFVSSISVPFIRLAALKF